MRSSEQAVTRSQDRYAVLQATGGYREVVDFNDHLI